MTTADTVAKLNRLLAIHQGSLANYLKDAAPWDKQGQVGDVLREMVASHERTADRLGSLILQLGGRTEKGHFPMRFTALNDLACSYLVKKLIDHQKRDIASIAELTGQIDDAYARELAEECLGAAKAHLDSLQEAAG